MPQLDSNGREDNEFQYDANFSITSIAHDKFKKILLLDGIEPSDLIQSLNPEFNR